MSDENLHVEKVEEGTRPEEIVENVTHADPDGPGGHHCSHCETNATEIAGLKTQIAELTKPVEELTIDADESPAVTHFLFR